MLVEYGKNLGDRIYDLNVINTVS